MENPATSLANPAEWLIDFVGGSKTKTGVRVTRETALTYAAVWAATVHISRDVAKLPLFVYRNTDSGKERATDHAAFSLLRHKPNNEMTSYVFRQTLQAHALLQGNGYAHIDRAGNGRPIQLIPLDPAKVTPVRVGGVLWYVVKINGEDRRLPPEDVLHIKGLGYDGLQGYSVIAKAAESLSLGMAARDYGARYFSNNARPDVIFEYPGQLSDVAKKNLRESWASIHQGLDNAHKAAILEEGMKCTPVTINARDSQMIEQRTFENRDVANWFGIPPHFLGDTTRTAFASLEQENQSYLDRTLDGWLVNWEEELREKLLTEREKEADSHFIEFLRQALVRADLKTRAEYYSKALAGLPWMTIDEVRSAETMNALGDGQGDKLIVPINMQRPAEQPKPDEPAPAPPAPSPVAEPDRAKRELLRDTVTRMVKRLTVHARKAAKQPDKLPEWIAEIEVKHGDILRSMLRPACALIFNGEGERAAHEIVDYLFENMRDCVMGGEIETRAAEIEETVPGEVVEIWINGGESHVLAQ